MKRILLIDNTDERRKRVSSLLRADDLCSCEERKEVCNAKDAVDAVRNLQPFTAAQSRIKDEWKGCVVSPNGFDIVLLHTTNAYAKHYFQEWLTSNVVILFTGGSDYWHDCPGVGLDSRRHFFTTPAAIDEFICDFAFEFLHGYLLNGFILNGLFEVRNVRKAAVQHHSGHSLISE